jgi:penicillin amidase
VGVLATLLQLWKGARLPSWTGRRAVAGPRAPLSIHRDRFGIPLIDAASEVDRAFGIGFCHGQDRAFQLELLHRVARGCLAELVGPAALPLDRLSRRIGFFRAAQQQWPLLDADLRADLEAYSAGVNAGRTVVPHELALLGGTMAPWHPVDCLAIAKVLSFKLAANWDAELVRLRVLLLDGPEALAAIDPTYTAHHPAIVPPGAAVGPALDRLADDINRFLAVTGAGSGSNNWAVDGSRTTTGRPLLANDPHLDASLPSHFYLVAARGPEHLVAGASLVGGPGVLAGHNGHIAWGLTAGLIDNTDLFLETMHADGRRVRQGDDWHECEIVEETIAIKGADPVVERVLITPRGPIVSPIVGDSTHTLSLCATWLKPRQVRGLFTLHRARTWDAFRDECRYWPIASQSLVYADASGGIGFQLLGDAPIRRGAIGDAHGLLPRPGWDSGTCWQDDLVPFEQIPHLFRPDCGWIATANNRHTPEGVGPYLGSDFIDGYRAVAIKQALEARRDWNVERFQALQMDQRTAAWDELRPFLLRLEGVPAELRDWDGHLHADSRPAAIYERWLIESLLRIARSLAPKSWEWVVGRGLTALTPYNFGCYRRTGHLVARLHREFERWRPDLQEALRLAVATRGAWGEQHRLVMHHPLSKAGGLLGSAMARIFNLGPVPYGGDADVINQAAVLPLHPTAPTDNIAAMRMVIDVGNWGASRWALPGGQSGNPFSPHYRDQFPLWLRGQGVPIALTPEEIPATERTTLMLEPLT